MKLTTNQVRLLRTAVASPAGRVPTSRATGHGSQGGRVNTGGRDHATAIKLRDAGLLTFLRHEHSTVVKNGWTTHVTDAIWVVTDAGRQALKDHVGA